MENLTFQRLADLDILHLARRERRGAVVLLHGYGADFTDLTSLASIVDPRQQWDWYFPNGFLEIPFAPLHSGRAWFPIDMVRLQYAQQAGQHRIFADHVPEGLPAASEQVQALLKGLAASYPLICLGGFSQGAMVSCDAALHSPVKPALLLQLSATFAAEQRWEAAFRAQPEVYRVLQSHGRHDSVLSFAAAEELRNFWEKRQFPHRFLAFQGGHEIPYDVLQALRIELNEFLPS